MGNKFSSFKISFFFFFFFLKMPFLWEPENLGGMKFLKKIILAKKKKMLVLKKQKKEIQGFIV